MIPFAFRKVQNRRGFPDFSHPQSCMDLHTVRTKRTVSHSLSAYTPYTASTSINNNLTLSETFLSTFCVEVQPALHILVPEDMSSGLKLRLQHFNTLLFTGTVQFLMNLIFCHLNSSTASTYIFSLLTQFFSFRSSAFLLSSLFPSSLIPYSSFTLLA